MIKHSATSLFSLLLSIAVLAQVPAKSGLEHIRESDLKNDVYALADDRFRGRESGTLDELKAAVWLEEQARKAGMQPAGEDHTFFQFFDLYRHRISPSSRMTIGNKQLYAWEDVFISQNAPAYVSAPVIYIGKGTKEVVASADLKGKIVALTPDNEGINLNISLPERRYYNYVRTKYYDDLIAKGALGIVFIVGDKLGEDAWYLSQSYAQRGTYDVEGGANTAKPTERPPVLWLREEALNLFNNAAPPLMTIDVQMESFTSPSVNLIGKIEGTDPKLKDEFVLVSGHIDHIGVRENYGTDSIYNGADDNATACAAVLAIARAYNAVKAKRSILFVLFGAEERSMKGSNYYVNNPLVDKDKVVAVLNADMIGNNHIDSAALLGSMYKNKNSDLLVKWALEANEEGPRFKLDTLWDKPDHPEFFYFRSDHAPFARAGYPSIFYTSMLHPIYHTPMDEPKTINYPKLHKITEWMYRTSWKLANNEERPTINPDFIYGRRAR